MPVHLAVAAPEVLHGLLAVAALKRPTRRGHSLPCSGSPRPSGCGRIEARRVASAWWTASAVLHGLLAVAALKPGADHPGMGHPLQSSPRPSGCGRIEAPPMTVSSALAGGHICGVARARARRQGRGPGFCDMVEGGHVGRREAPRGQAPTWPRDLTVRDSNSLGSRVISACLSAGTRVSSAPSSTSLFAQGL
jgi:hypothetical protein